VPVPTSDPSHRKLLRGVIFDDHLTSCPRIPRDQQSPVTKQALFSARPHFLSTQVHTKPRQIPPQACALTVMRSAPPECTWRNQKTRGSQPFCVCSFAGAERSGQEIRKDLGSPIVSSFLTLDLEPQKMASDTCISPKNVGDDGLTDDGKVGKWSRGAALDNRNTWLSLLAGCASRQKRLAAKGTSSEYICFTSE
jgi:hypothetical protein